MINEFNYTIIFLTLIVASYTDIKTREVPDWLNYLLIAFGIGSGIIHSLVFLDYKPFLFSLLGFLAMLFLALLMFYTGQWGGGDAKLLMGLGAIIGLEPRFDSMLALFIINLIIFGAIYGLFWSFGIVFANWQKFKKEFIRMLSQEFYIKVRKINLALMLLLFVILLLAKDALYRLFILFFMLLISLSLYLWLAIKAIENSCMLKLVEPEKLTEGDWIAKDVVVSGKYICGPKDLGIEKSQIRKLMQLKEKGKIKKILMKQGIPFVPSFLLAFVATLVILSTNITKEILFAFI